MKPAIPSLGSICISRCGHDAGRTYLVVKVIDPGFVLVCDGIYRKTENPKRKRVAHLQFTGGRADGRLLEQILAGTAKDNEIHKTILTTDGTK